MIQEREKADIIAIRGSILHYLEDPGERPDESAWEFYEDGLLLAQNGYITKLADAQELMPQLPKQLAVTDYSGKLIVPGFIDTHVHFVQTDIIASYGTRLLEWLDKYTFPAERAFANEAHATEVAEFFLEELLRNGTTTALVLGSVHKVSVEALFIAARARRMRLIAGKVMMDRNCPKDLRDTAAAGYEDSKELILRWHNLGRLHYAISPRFAPTSTAMQLKHAGRLAGEYPDVFVHTHLAENEEEVAWVKELFPARRSYLDVYEHYGLLRERTILAHGIWLNRQDRMRLHTTGAALAHCPTCNLFMGSGLFDLQATMRTGTMVALGSDIGGGTTFNMLQVMHDAYKVAQMLGHSLSPLRAFYLATLAGARALHIDDRLGNFLPGKEADFVVLDPRATPLLARRTSATGDLADKLFLLMMLGDDRAISQTYVMGELAYDATTQVDWKNPGRKLD